MPRIFSNREIPNWGKNVMLKKTLILLKSTTINIVVLSKTYCVTNLDSFFNNKLLPSVSLEYGLLVMVRFVEV